MTFGNNLGEHYICQLLNSIQLIDDRQSDAKIKEIIKETSWRNNLIEQLFKSLEDWDKDIVEE